MNANVDSLLSQENCDRAKQLVTAIESGDRENVLQIVSDMSSLVESDLFQNVGKLTRNLHDTFRDIGSESESEFFDPAKFPDARERLQHVIQLTEDSANTTLDCVEKALPVIQERGDRAAELLERWERLCKKEMALSHFKELSDDIQAYLSGTKDLSATLQSGLNDVLMAQGYQDLTGQMIRQVINLVDELEQKLLDLVTSASSESVQGAIQAKNNSKQDERKSLMQGEGPQLNKDADDVMSSQDQVDDLLASLGF
ncbi:MAG: protein phosphatase CheZ [Pseudomonadota bacterium]